jgi:hypothetical protein
VMYVLQARGLMQSSSGDALCDSNSGLYIISSRNQPLLIGSGCPTRASCPRFHQAPTNTIPEHLPLHPSCCRPFISPRLPHPAPPTQTQAPPTTQTKGRWLVWRHWTPPWWHWPSVRPPTTRHTSRPRPAPSAQWGHPQKRHSRCVCVWGGGGGMRKGCVGWVGFRYGWLGQAGHARQGRTYW